MALEPMKDVSSSEQEDDDLLPPPKVTSSAKQEARSAREEKLRQMMEDSSADEAEGSNPLPSFLCILYQNISVSQYRRIYFKLIAALHPADAMDLDPNEEPPPEEPVPAQPGVKETAEEVPTVTISGGRRRGRRKVMKKKMIKDEDGYLGTLFSSP